MLTFVGTLEISFWYGVSILRFERCSISTGAQRRYVKYMESYFSGLVGQVELRSSASKPDIETYIALRRESIGVYPCLALVE